MESIFCINRYETSNHMVKNITINVYILILSSKCLSNKMFLLNEINIFVCLVVVVTELHRSIKKFYLWLRPETI